MKKNSKKFGFYFLFCLLFWGMLFCGLYRKNKISLIDVKQYPDQVSLQELVKNTEINETSDFYFDIYAGNFNSPDIPNIKNHHHKNILFLGSNASLSFEKLAQYDYIFVATNELDNFLKANNISHFFVPPFIPQTDVLSSVCAENHQQPQCYWLVIGKQPDVIKVLKERQQSYKEFEKLTPEIISLLLDDLDNISGIISNRSIGFENVLDISPFFLYAIQKKIPVLCDNIMTETQINTNNSNLTYFFADTLSYYTYMSDIIDFFKCQSCRLKKAQKAQFLLNHLYSTESTGNIIQQILLNAKLSDIHIKDVITIISPTHAGLYNNGDYWIAKDMEDEFEKTHLNAFTMFPLSTYPFLGDVSIYIRGAYPLLNPKQNTSDKVSLTYLIFPQTDIISPEEYAVSMQNELSKNDAVLVASPRMTEIMRTLNLSAHYVPQFTNIQKFYPDYDENLKSEVLFVGSNDFYRTAAPTVFEAGLPISIYGPKWNGLAIAEYIDNQILRKYYSSAKIVLNDTRPDMKRFGFISNRIFDVTASGGFLISDYMKEIEEIYGDSIPMWKNKKELIELVKYYLDPNHEAERQEKAMRAHKITLKNFTSQVIAKKINEIIAEIKKRKNL